MRNSNFFKTIFKIVAIEIVKNNVNKILSIYVLFYLYKLYQIMYVYFIFVCIVNTHKRN